MNLNGAIIYQGPSLLDGKPIVVIVNGLKKNSRNRKTGDMVQTYILRSDMSPIIAMQNGSDSSICGACPHRGIATGSANVGRTCYVNVGQGPTKVYDGFKRGIYATIDSDKIAYVGAGRNVRIGSYGDPAAVPTHIWTALISKAEGHTGYTHQWRSASSLRTIIMASADSENDAREAQKQGWRTFRVALPCDAPKIETEVSCPASREAGKKLICATCLACNGANGRKGSIVIQAHGGSAVMANIKKRAESNFGFELSI